MLSADLNEPHASERFGKDPVPPNFGEKKPDNRRWRIALIGTGNIAETHAAVPTEHENVEITAALDVEPQRAVGATLRFHSHYLYGLFSSKRFIAERDLQCRTGS